MTRDELITATKAYVHDMDLSLADTFIELVEARIKQEVRAPEMVTYTTIDTGAVAAVANNAWALPTDYLEMRDVWATVAGNRCTLMATGRDEMARASASASSVPAYYSIYDDLIEFQPGPGERDIELVYFGAPSALVNGTDTNDVIAAYPALYLYGLIAQFQMVAQDSEQYAMAESGFAQEVQRINLYAWNRSWGTSPVMRGSGNNYSGRGARL